MTDAVVQQPPPQMNSMSKMQDVSAKPNMGKEHIPENELWNDGLICAFELVKGHRKLIRHRSLPMQETGAPLHTKKHAGRNGHHAASPVLH
jgi:hypothetical protein